MDFKRLLEAIDPEEIFKPASEEELAARPREDEAALNITRFQLPRQVTDTGNFVLTVHDPGGDFQIELDGEAIVGGTLNEDGTVLMSRSADPRLAISSLVNILFTLGDTNPGVV